jgi:hypothetical protein
MARSSLDGIERRSPTPAGQDSAALGPSDSSDSGSDVAGLGNLDDGDPGAPVDVMTADDREHPCVASETLGAGADTDAAGTGERRSGVGDGGALDAPDLAPDHVVSVNEISAAYDDLQAVFQAGDEEPPPRALDIATAVQADADESRAKEAEAEDNAELPATRATGATRGRTRASGAAKPRKRTRAKSAAVKAR